MRIEGRDFEPLEGAFEGLGCDNVLVNTVSPAFIATPMTDKMTEKRAGEKGVSFDEAIEPFLEEERPGMTLHRHGTADEVASAIVFPCSERASFITGANIRVDSGSVITVAAEAIILPREGGGPGSRAMSSAALAPASAGERQREEAGPQ